MARRPRLLVLSIAAALLASACAGTSPSGGPTSPPPPPGSPRSLPALKLAVLDAVGGRLDYCDPDAYPVAHGDPLDDANERLPTIEADAVTFAAILEHQHLTPGQAFTPDQLIAINRDYKQIQAIDLRPSGDGYRFQVLVPKVSSDTGNELVSGTVTASGSVSVERRDPGEALSCPICLPQGVGIATPSGDVPVQDIRPGTRVWTTDRKGHRVIGVVLRTGHMRAPLGHRVLRVSLVDGRSFVASPGHPTADGRAVGELLPGDRLDGSRVKTVVPFAHSGSLTYDLMPSGPTGTYFVNGVLLGSSLVQPDRRAAR